MNDRQIKRTRKFLLIEGVSMLIVVSLVFIVGKFWISPLFASEDTNADLNSGSSFFQKHTVYASELETFEEMKTQLKLDLSPFNDFIPKSIETLDTLYNGLEVLEKESTEPVVDTPEIAEKYGHLYSEHNLYLLAKIIQCEQGYQDPEFYDAKVMVGLVVLNRAISDGFPDTVEGVIFQKNQFQPTFDGSWERKEPTEFDYEAAKAAFAGLQMPDQLNEALFFMNPEHSTQKNINWFRSSLTYVGDSGTHEFYK